MESKLGWLKGLPIAGAYFTLSFAYGVSAAHVDISLFNTLLMSVIVFAGSAQMIAVGLLALGVSSPSIIATTFIVNLRHVLFGAAIVPLTRGWKSWQRLLFSLELTDETFALHSVELPGYPPLRSTFLVNLMAHGAWILGSGCGHQAHSSIPDLDRLGFDFALGAMFIGLLVLQIRTRLQLGVALFSGFLAVGLKVAGMSSFSIIVATVLGATLGLALELWITAKRH